MNQVPSNPIDIHPAYSELNFDIKLSELFHHFGLVNGTDEYGRNPYNMIVAAQEKSTAAAVAQAREQEHDKIYGLYNEMFERDGFRSFESLIPMDIAAFFDRLKEMEQTPKQEPTK